MAQERTVDRSRMIVSGGLCLVAATAFEYARTQNVSEKSALVNDVFILKLLIFLPLQVITISKNQLLKSFLPLFKTNSILPWLAKLLRNLFMIVQIIESLVWD